MIAGLLNIHKPTGMSSRRVVDIVARRAGTKRVGHAGTLDPLASGVLVVCLGWATRLVDFVQELPKTYAARFRLGQSSNTDDITGEIVAACAPDAPQPTRSQVETALGAFGGPIMQVPPQFSAVHVAGRRAHKLARRGKTVVLSPRPVHVHRIALIEYTFPDLAVEIECSSGTYIRSIARDLGEVLGCGGLMAALVRRSIGGFSLEKSASIEEIASRPLADLLLPPAAAVAHLPRHPITLEEHALLTRGMPLNFPGPAAFPAIQLVALVDAKGRLLALAELDPADQVLRPRRVFEGSP